MLENYLLDHNSPRRGDTFASAGAAQAWFFKILTERMYQENRGRLKTPARSTIFTRKRRDFRCRYITKFSKFKDYMINGETEEHCRTCSFVLLDQNQQVLEDVLVGRWGGAADAIAFYTLFLLSASSRQSWGIVICDFQFVSHGSILTNSLLIWLCSLLSLTTSRVQSITFVIEGLSLQNPVLGNEFFRVTVRGGGFSMLDNFLGKGRSDIARLGLDSSLLIFLLSFGEMWTSLVLCGHCSWTSSALTKGSHRSIGSWTSSALTKGFHRSLKMNLTFLRVPPGEYRELVLTIPWGSKGCMLVIRFSITIVNCESAKVWVLGTKKPLENGMNRPYRYRLGYRYVTKRGHKPP
jgi:hypothetical protein